MFLGIAIAGYKIVKSLDETPNIGDISTNQGLIVLDASNKTGSNGIPAYVIVIVGLLIVLAIATPTLIQLGAALLRLFHTDTVVTQPDLTMEERRGRRFTSAEDQSRAQGQMRNIKEHFEQIQDAAGSDILPE